MQFALEQSKKGLQFTGRQSWVALGYAAEKTKENMPAMRRGLLFIGVKFVHGVGIVTEYLGASCKSVGMQKELEMSLEN